MPRPRARIGIEFGGCTPYGAHRCSQAIPRRAFRDAALRSKVSRAFQGLIGLRNGKLLRPDRRI
jgi:hypothetical protein